MNQDIKNFRNHKIIFCDSEDSLKQSFKQGLRKDSLIRTSSPALLINKKLKTKAIKPKINKKLQIFQKYFATRTNFLEICARGSNFSEIFCNWKFFFDICARGSNIYLIFWNWENFF